MTLEEENQMLRQQVEVLEGAVKIYREAYATCSRDFQKLAAKCHEEYQNRKES